MKYVLEDFFRMVTPRIADAGRFKTIGSAWLLISSPNDTEDVANGIPTDQCVMVEYDPISQIIENISIPLKDRDIISIFTQNDKHDHISSIVENVDWNDIIELCREYVNDGGFYG